MKNDLRLKYDNLYVNLKKYISYNTFCDLYNKFNSDIELSLKYYIIDKVVSEFKLDVNNYQQFSKLYDVINDINLIINPKFIEYLLHEYPIILSMVENIGVSCEKFIRENNVDLITNNYLLKCLLISHYKLVSNCESEFGFYNDEDLILLYKNENNIKARNEIILRNIGLITSVCNKFCKNPSDFDDLLQSGILGFIRGLEQFDLSAGVKFSTYVMYWILQYVRFESLSLYSFLSTSKYFKNKYFSFMKKYATLCNEDVDYSIMDLQKITGFDSELIKSFVMVKNGPLSLDNDNDNENYSLIDKVSFSSSLSSSSFEDVILGEIFFDEMCEKCGLTVKEKEILSRYFGFNGDRENHKEIAEVFGCTHQYIGLIKTVALKKIRKSYFK